MDHYIPDGHAFVQDEVIYYSPNSSLKIYVPPPPNPNDYMFYAGDCNLINFLNPRHWSSAYRWLGFVPRDPIPPIGLFQPFEFTRPIPKYRDTRFIGYGLPEDVADEWDDTENLLFRVYFILAKKLEWRPPIKPTPVFFLRPKKLFMKKAAAIRHIERCRGWISMWVGLVSYTIAHTIRVTKEDMSFSWSVYLAQQGISQRSVDKLQVSIVCKFDATVPRVGVILDWLGASHDCPPVEWLVENHIPVWFPWTERHSDMVYRKKFPPTLAPKFSPHEMLLPLRTSSSISSLQHDQRPEEVALPKRAMPSTSSHASQTSPPSQVISNTSAPTLAKPQPGKRGNRFLSDVQEAHLKTLPWKSFFDKRDEQNKVKEAKETPKERQARLQRQTAPSKKAGNNYRFYVWDWDATQSVLVRKQVFGAEIEEAMDCPDIQRRFDPFTRTWEICEYFGDEEEDQEAVRQEAQQFAEEEDSFNNSAGQQDHDNYNNDRLSRPVPSDSGNALPSYLPVPVQWRPLDVHITLRYYHGFVPPVQVASCLISPEKWALTTPKFGFSAHIPITPRSSAIVDFIEGLESSTLPESFDLRQGHPCAVRKDIFDTLFLRQGSKYILNTSSIQRSDGDPAVPQWVLAVDDLLTAIIIYRLLKVPEDNGQKKITCIQRLAEELLSQCIPFHTLLPTPNFQCSLSDIRTSIPIRLPGHQFTPADYITYQEVRHAVLESDRARAALLAGGIVARIALDHIPIGKAIEGPSLAVTQFSQGMSFQPSQVVYSDDDLTKDELDIICGMYRVYTGKGTQDSRESWWPPQSLWQKPNACGMNLGYWSEANEVWYQTRKRDIELGNALPLNSTQWRSMLRAGPDSQCRTIRKATTVFASEYFH